MDDTEGEQFGDVRVEKAMECAFWFPSGRGGQI